MVYQGSNCLVDERSPSFPSQVVVDKQKNAMVRSRSRSSSVVSGDDEHVAPASAFLGSWEESAADRISSEVLKCESELQEQQRPYMVGLTGVPGSGKTLSSFLLQSLLENKGLSCMVATHDGYHYPLDYLRLHTLDPQDAIYRRGAPDTFDPAGLYRDLTRIRYNPHNETVVKMPGFDHSKGDPEPDCHMFDRERNKVVICEGLYILHDQDGWEGIKSLFDFTIFIDQDVEVCLQRVKIRNRQIPGYSPEEIDERTEIVDRANAETVLRSMSKADLVVEAKRQNAAYLQLQDVSENHQEDYEYDYELSALGLPDNTIHPSHYSMTDLSIHNTIDHIPSRPETPVGFLGDNKVAPPPAAAASGTWEPAMALRIKELHENAQLNRPFMVALVGLPGGGKSVSSFLLADALDRMGLDCFVTPHDGYHFPLDYLRTQPNPADLVYRRGAPETFEPSALYRDLTRIRESMDEIIIKLPAFNHAHADPEPDTHIFDRHKHKVVLCEGLYLLHDDHGWENIKSLFDLSIFLDTPLELCLDRVKIRNQCIPGYTPEEIAIRVEIVDRANAMLVLKSRDRADFVQESGHSMQNTAHTVKSEADK